MQQSSVAEQITETFEEAAPEPAPARRQPRLFEPESHTATLAISGTWPRPAIVMDSGPYRPFRIT